MIARLSVLALVPLLALAGCGKRPTTAPEAERAIRDCGMIPDLVQWRVSEDGALEVARKRPGVVGPSLSEADCLTDWAGRNHVKLGFVDREGSGS